MIPPVSQPDPLALPAPAWLLWALLLLMFFLHLIPMNLVLGGSIIGAIARVRGRRPDRPHEAQLAHIAVKAMPVLISVTVTLGVLGQRHQVSTDKEGLFELALKGPLPVGRHPVTASLPAYAIPGQVVDVADLPPDIRGDTRTAAAAVDGDWRRALEL